MPPLEAAAGQEHREAVDVVVAAAVGVTAGVCGVRPISPAQSTMVCVEQAALLQVDDQGGDGLVGDRGRSSRGSS